MPQGCIGYLTGARENRGRLGVTAGTRVEQQTDVLRRLVWARFVTALHKEGCLGIVEQLCQQSAPVSRKRLDRRTIEDVEAVLELEVDLTLVLNRYCVGQLHGIDLFWLVRRCFRLPS